MVNRIMNWRELKKNGHTIIAGAVSGGLDSSIIASILQHKSSKPIKTFSICPLEVILPPDLI